MSTGFLACTHNFGAREGELGGRLLALDNRIGSSTSKDFPNIGQGSQDGIIATDDD